MVTTGAKEMGGDGHHRGKKMDGDGYHWSKGNGW